MTNAGSPDVNNGHIKIANELWEALIDAKLSAREWNLVACIIRKTYGWNKYEDKISLSQFEHMTGIAKNKIWAVVKGLLERNIIHKSIPQKGHIVIPTYSINKHYKQWKHINRSTPKRGIPQKGVEVYPKLGMKYTPKRGTTKDTIQKTLLQKTTPKLSLTETQLRLIELLKSKILENNPGAIISPAYKNTWGKDIEKMMRLDGRSADQVRAVILWSQASDFWCSNIMSFNKLRQQFDKLTMQMKRGGNHGYSDPEKHKRGF